MSIEMRQPTVEQVLSKALRDRDTQFGDVDFGKAVSGEAILNQLRNLESDEDGPAGRFRLFHGRPDFTGPIVVGLEAGESGRESVVVLGVQNATDAAVFLRAGDTYTHVRLFVGTPRETESVTSRRMAADSRTKQASRMEKLDEVSTYLRSKLGT